MVIAAIEQRWSLTQIRAQIKSSQISPSVINLEPKQRIQSTLKKAASVKVWQPQQWKKIDKLLAQIDELLAQ